MNEDKYDVAIVGGSIAGCTAATFLARRGAKVAVLERAADPNAYKTMCTHFIQPSATATLERLGLVEEIEAAGGIRNGTEAWSRYGWVKPRPGPAYPHPPYGYDIQRKKLDPMIRRLTADTPGVDFLWGATATRLLSPGIRPNGVSARIRGEGERSIQARVVVGADGRNSAVARWAGVPGRVKPHGRFAYFAYYRDLPLVSGDNTLFWFLDPVVSYAFPQDDGLTLMATFQPLDELDTFKHDLEGSFTRAFEGLPNAPDLSRGERVSKILGKLSMPNVYRPAARGSVAFIGDAALAADPLWGVGCGFALQTGEWLAEEVGDVLVGGGDVEVALDRYRKRHRRWFLPQHLMISDFSTGRPFNPLEKLFFSAATRDERTALHLHALGARSIGPIEFIRASALARALRVNLTPRPSHADRIEAVPTPTGSPGSPDRTLASDAPVSA
jgi:2-polyprenyl-6-methoxyphenol hydroxylase-like FAD-dependent oxidoreductase